MDDRELLLNAAKAIGCHGAHYEDGSWLEIRYGYTVALHHDNLDSYWNPLESDGDAFRLANHLHFAIDIGCISTSIDGLLDRDKAMAVEVHGANPCAATRRAIVRAAAEIGKNADAPLTRAD